MSATLPSWTEQHEQVYRKSIGERWCFRCRKRREFEYVVMVPVELSYYEPSIHIECTVCKLVDGDMFPGTHREWRS